MKHLFFIIIVLVGIKNLSAQTEKELLNQAKSYLHDGYYSEAMEICTNILAKNSKNEIAYLYKAEVQLNIMQFDNSLLNIDKAITINPNNSSSYTLKGRVKLKQYEFKSKDTAYSNEAKVNFDKALNINPNDIEALNSLAEYYQYCIGDIKAAKAQYDKSLSIDKTQPNVFYNRGSLKGYLNDSIGALDDFTSAITLNPKKGAYYIERAKIYEGLGNYKKGFIDYNKAIAIDSSALGFIGRGRTAFYQKHYDFSIKDFSFIINQTIIAESNNYTSIYSYDCPAAYFYRGYCYLNLNDKLNACSDWGNALQRGIKPAENLIVTYCK